MTDKDTWRNPAVHHDLFLTDAHKFQLYLSVKDLKSGVLTDACKAFQGNVERVSILSKITNLVVDATTRNTLMLCQATFEALGKAVMNDAEARDAINRKAVGEAYDRIAATEFTHEGFFSDKQWMLYIFQCDNLRYHKAERVNSPLSWSGYHALLAFQIIGAWTALETLITDVWVAAVNAHPELAARCSKDKSFTIQRLQQHDFNWTGRVGELLKDKMKLDDWDKAKQTYEQTFDAPRLDAALASITLEAARLIRNSIVHNAGNANSDFAGKRKNFHRPWRDVREGEQLPLDGRRVARLTSIIVLTGNRLLRKVDGKLQMCGLRASK